MKLEQLTTTDFDILGELALDTVYGGKPKELILLRERQSENYISRDDNFSFFLRDYKSRNSK